MKKIGIIVGSLRTESYARKWAKNILPLYPGDYETRIIDIAQLPFYNEEFDEPGPLPEVIRHFREEIKGLDGIVFVTPEYNRSIPPALKNAIDIASRPAGSFILSKKPALVISHSISRLAGFGANHHLRQVLVFVDMPTVAQPEVYLGDSAEAFDEKGKVIKASRMALLQKAVDAHVDLIKRFEK